MPFQNTNVYNFSEITISSIAEVGGVYGLARATLLRPGYYTILYVGKSGNLRERLKYHLNNPPVPELPTSSPSALIMRRDEQSASSN